jgi:MFS family permease
MIQQARGSASDESMRPAYPIMAAVFLSFMVIGMALPVLSLHVHNVLGFGPFVVGLVAGCQFAASLVSRLWAGHLADSKGSKHAVVLGLGGAIAAGLFYLLSLAMLAERIVSVGLLLVGRALMGGAESLIITGGMTWALGLVSQSQAARSISWVGMAMFAAMAVGAPLGSAVFNRWTFAGIAISTVALPVIALALTVVLKPYIPAARKSVPIRMVLGAVTLPGIGFTLSGITFGAITAFITLFFSVSHWKYGALAFTAFAAALIATRIVGGHLPDRRGGAQVALGCLFVQAAGLTAIGLATGPAMAIVGALVTGSGFSLVFPSLGLEAVRRAPSEARGTAMSLYNAFLDLTLGLVSPALGLLAGLAGMRSVFIASAVAALLAAPICLALIRVPPPSRE